MVTEQVYFKKNVDFSVGIRMYQRDNEGVVLNGANPWIGIPADDLKDFMRANRQAIESGLIVQISEPPLEFNTANTITDEEADALVKNLFSLRKKLPEITSEATLGKLYATAVEQKRSQKIVDMIKERLEDITPAGMMGIDWGKDEKDSGGE
jgi:hypothetical protein